MRRSLIAVVILLSLTFAGAALTRKLDNLHHAPASMQRKKSTRKARPRSESPTSGVSNGVRVRAVSIQAAGKTWGEESEASKLEAEEGEEILVVHLTFRATPALSSTAEVKFSRPELLLKEGQTGRTNLAGFELRQYPGTPINDEMDIPFIVAEGAEPQALMVGEAALDLTTLEITEPPDPNASLPPSIKEMMERNKQDQEIRDLIRKSDEDRKRIQDMLKPIPTDRVKPLVIDPNFHVPTLKEMQDMNRPLASPSPSPTPSPSSEGTSLRAS